MISMICERINKIRLDSAKTGKSCFNCKYFMSYDYRAAWVRCKKRKVYQYFFGELLDCKYWKKEN